MKHILITGGTGFLGKQVLKCLSKKNLSIRIITRSNNNFYSKYQNVTEVINTENFFTETRGWYEDICKNIDTVIHLAWYAEPGKYLESPQNLECLSGTLNFAQAAANKGIKKFVGIGTCLEYDLTTSKPLSIKSPLKPQFLYSTAKMTAFLLLSKYFKNESIDFLWNRVFYLYGEGEDDRRLVAFIRKKLSSNEMVDLTSGTQVRDFMDIEAAGSIIADASVGLNVGPFNVCSGKGQSVKELAENIADEYGKRNLLNFGSRQDNISEAPYIVGVRTKIIETK